MTPRSTRPVTTVPRPEIENTSSTGIRTGWSIGRSGCGMYASTLFISSRMAVVTERLVRCLRGRPSAEPLMIGILSPGNSYFEKQFADLELDEFEQFRIVDHVALVQEHDERGNADLTGEQDVLAGLRHRAVGSRHDQDRTVHLGGAR
jgi:hypothetical protein